MPENSESAEEMKFDFASWATDHGLKRKTTQALSDQDLDTQDMLLKSTESDIAHLNLTLGQARALRAALGALGHRRFVEHDEEGEREATAPAMIDPVAHIQQLLSSASDNLEALLTGETSPPTDQAGGSSAQVPIPGQASQIGVSNPAYGNKALAAMCDPLLILAVKSD